MEHDNDLFIEELNEPYAGDVEGVDLAARFRVLSVGAAYRCLAAQSHYRPKGAEKRHAMRKRQYAHDIGE